MYLHDVFASDVPQSEPQTPGQVLNHAGGYVFAVDDWTRLDRFLILGTEKGIYYAGEREMTFATIASLDRCLVVDGPRTVARIVEISQAGRAPKNEPALFALARAASIKGSDSAATRREALAALPKVARTGTHLLHFVDYAQLQRGWGRGLRNAVGAWFTQRKPDDLVYQVLKYRSRDGMAMRDVLRLAHPSGSGQIQEVLHWIARGWDGVGEDPHPDAVLARIWAFERLQKATNPDQAAALIREYRLPRETVPTHLINERVVWEALMPGLGITALLRNLPTLTRVGYFGDTENRARVLARLADADEFRRGRVHPFAVFVAMLTYSGGKNLRGSHTWIPDGRIIDGLNGAFPLAFYTSAPVGKRFLLAVDVSASMGNPVINGVPGLTPRTAAAAMALVTTGLEEHVQTVTFSCEPQHQAYSYLSLPYGRSLPFRGVNVADPDMGLQPFPISPKQRLDDLAVRMANLNFGGTDCSLPMRYAMKHALEVDAFVVYTDNETWAGPVHAHTALEQYRQASGIPAKLVVQAFTATEFSIANPNDGGMLDIAGLDSAAPVLMADFVRGDVSL